MKTKVLFTLSIALSGCLLLSGCMSTDHSSASAVPNDREYRKAGEVEIRMLVWNPLFLRSPEERAAALLNAAEEEAKERYGPEAILAHVELSSRWSPYSLILGLDLFGFAEEGSLTAEALIPAPPSPPSLPPPEPEREIRITYPILPQERFDDSYGYIGIDYLTRPVVLEKIKARLDRRDANPDEYQKAYDKVPEGGHLILKIGRLDLMHANTRWYSYVVTREGEPIINREGEEGIPNIKGRDGFWWNEVIVPLKRPVEDRIGVRITDTNKNLSYHFEVVRLEEKL